jgi:hypothetical protein
MEKAEKHRTQKINRPDSASSSSKMELDRLSLFYDKSNKTAVKSAFFFVSSLQYGSNQECGTAEESDRAGIFDRRSNTQQLE